MRNADKIRRAIRQLSQGDNDVKPFGIIATVVSVDGGAGTCEVAPLDGTANLSDIRLKPEAVNSVFYPVPTVGSVVLIELINDSEGFISMFSQCDSLKIMDGTLGGLIKIEDLVGKINALESDLNDLKAALSSWVPVASDGGLALKAGLAAYIAATITPTVRLDLENDKITHGIP
jgi:hypothetical protein